MREVAPGIYQLQIPIPSASLDYVNLYLVQGENGYLLVDTGWDTEEAFDSLKKQLTEIGVGFDDISEIVITHIHPDHYGLAGRLKQLSKAKIALHYHERRHIIARYINMEKLLRQIEQRLHLNGVPVHELPELKAASLRLKRFVTATFPDITLHSGEKISTATFDFKVLWTPGHSPGHICLYEPKRKIFISGDHVLPNITPNIGLNPQSGVNPLDDYLNSLSTIKQLEVNLILPGHEYPFTTWHKRIEELIQHHKERNSEILQAIGTESKTAYQISAEVRWGSHRGGVGWQNLTPWDKRMAIMETLAHLESMRFAGKVEKFLRGSTVYYHILDTAK